MEKCAALAVVGCAKEGVDQPTEISAGCSSLWTRVPGFAFVLQDSSSVLAHIKINLWLPRIFLQTLNSDYVIFR